MAIISLVLNSVVAQQEQDVEATPPPVQGKVTLEDHARKNDKKTEGELRAIKPMTNAYQQTLSTTRANKRRQKPPYLHFI